MVSTRSKPKEARISKGLNPLVLSCFFLSGLSGLIYEVLWVRMIDKVIGSAPFAVATVLTVFMGGLALGSFIAGRRIDGVGNRERLLSLYGKIEVGVGVYGLLLPLLIVMVKPAYALLYHHLFQSFWLYSMLSFLGCALLLLAPAALMGATLPILCRFYVTHLDHLGARTGRLYGLNTLGAAAGACLAGFVLIRGLGVWGSLFLAAGINFLVGLLCMTLGRKRDGLGQAHRVSPSQHPPVSPFTKEGKETRGGVGDFWVLGILAVTGFSSMAYEVIWTRLLGLIIGPTTYSFTLVLTVFIVGLGLGSILFGWLGDRIERVFPLLAMTQMGAAFLALMISHFLGNSQFFFAKLIYVFKDHFDKMVLVQSVALFLAMLGPTLLLGAAFPLANRLYARSLPGMGRAIGAAYAMNTLGAILGSFAAGFLLIPFLGKENGLRLIVGLQFLFALSACGAWMFKSGPRPRLWLPISGIALAAWTALFIRYPAWDPQLLSFGRYHHFNTLEADLLTTPWIKALVKGPHILKRQERGRKVLFYGDGLAGFTTVERYTDSLNTVKLTLLNSGKPDASSHGDRSTQTLLAHVPLLFHPGAEKVMVLGLASGMTAGEALHYPIKRLDIVEINREVVKACRFFNPWNNHCLDDPRSRIIVQDGRNHLALTGETYDVITSEPSNPWMAGLANLYTLEFFRTVKRRLRKGGIFVQWIHSYEMDWHTFALAGRTFARVFPNSLLMTTLTGVGDYLLVGLTGARGLDLDAAKRNLPHCQRSTNMSLKDPRLLFHLILSEDLAGLFGPGPLHTDNRPRLEFAAPRQLYRNDPTIEENIARGRILSKKTKVMVEATSAVDNQLDLVEFSASVFSPLFQIIDPDDVTPAQKARYMKGLDDYCSGTLVEDYRVFPGLWLREKCAEFQAPKIRERLALHKEDAEAYYSLGVALKEMGEKGAAIKAYEKGLSLNPIDVRALNNVGVMHMENHASDKALAAFKKVVSIHPGHARAYFNMAHIAFRRGEKEGAARYLRKGLQYEDNRRARALLKQLRPSPFSDLDKSPP
ncbi:MAG: tetratricopeptide repeat protein [Deltaproteobacteria bacterium]|nr:tetratricopeptide repeat protein [Deltaproteobacteria bacterium]